MTRKTFARVKHHFLFRIVKGDGTEKIVRAPALVVKATQVVTLTVTARHVQNAIDQHGIGHPSKCTMALCCYSHKDLFPHRVEGHVDWNYSRAFVVSKTNEYGMPIECVAYEHDSDIARVNDTRDGLKKLLARIRKYGSITVHLRPYRKRSVEKRPGRNRKRSGARDDVVRLGGNRRRDIAHVHLGVGPDEAAS